MSIKKIYEVCDNCKGLGCTVGFNPPKMKYDRPEKTNIQCSKCKGTGKGRLVYLIETKERYRPFGL